MGGLQCTLGQRMESGGKIAFFGNFYDALRALTSKAKKDLGRESAISGELEIKSVIFWTVFALRLGTPKTAIFGCFVVESEAAVA